MEKSRERKSARTESVRKMYDGKGCVILGSKITTGEVNQEFTKQEKVISLFKFIEELNKFKQKVVLTVSDYPWWRSVDSLPDHPKNIRVYYRDRVEEEDAENITDALLSVHKPEFQSFPNPDPI